MSKLLPPLVLMRLLLRLGGRKIRAGRELEQRQREPKPGAGQEVAEWVQQVQQQQRVQLTQQAPPPPQALPQAATRVQQD
jgi:hypothetical protein